MGRTCRKFSPLAGGWGPVSSGPGFQDHSAGGSYIRCGGGLGLGCTILTFLRKAGYLLLSSATSWLAASGSASSALVPDPAPSLLTVDLAGSGAVGDRFSDMLRC